jgi:hypothetical protein
MWGADCARELAICVGCWCDVAKLFCRILCKTCCQIFGNAYNYQQATLSLAKMLRNRITFNRAKHDAKRSRSPWKGDQCDKGASE